MLVQSVDKDYKFMDITLNIIFIDTLLFGTTQCYKYFNVDLLFFLGKVKLVSWTL